MDITMLFKACVKTIRMRNKSLNSLLGTQNQKDDKNRILKKHTHKDNFTSKTKSLLNQITQLRDFLLENKKAYLNFKRADDEVSGMTDAQRDEIEKGAQTIIRTCCVIISDMRKELTKLKCSAQNLEHRKALIDIVENYLKAVCKMYSEQKALRTRKILEHNRMLKLEYKLSHVDDAYAIQRILPATNDLPANDEKEDSPSKKYTLNDDSPVLSEDDHQLSPEEMQMFESENEQLYNELNSLDEEVKQIESKVVHISELQQLFTEKVLEQDKDIERISTTVVGATENLRDANDQIRQAIQRNAGLRVWILFFLLVMSFSLLFLDWYND